MPAKPRKIWAVCRLLVSRARPTVHSQWPAAVVATYANQAPVIGKPPSRLGSPVVPELIRSTTPKSTVSTSGTSGVRPRPYKQQELAASQLQCVADGLNPFDGPFNKPLSGYKFPPPDIPQGKLHETKFHMKYRYDEGISQITRLLMRDGKLSKAQRNMAMVLNYLRTSPPPKANPQRPLLPGSPPPENLPLKPNIYLMLALESVAPLIRIRGFTGLAGGGKALEVPVPISRWARRRTAFTWIMDAVNKRQSLGSGKKMLAHRIGEEIVAIVEGRSPVWARRDQLHKTGTSLRANLNSPNLLKKRSS